MQLWLVVIGDDKDTEEDKKEEEANGMALLSSSSFHIMMVRMGEGERNHTRSSKDEVDHRPTMISRTAGRKRATKQTRQNHSPYPIRLVCLVCFV